MTKHDVVFDEEALWGAKRASSHCQHPDSVRFVVSFDDRKRIFAGRFVKGLFWQRLFSIPFGWIGVRTGWGGNYD
jgi:hypothetical protein